jgi:hypothetical protein
MSLIFTYIWTKIKLMWSKFNDLNGMQFFKFTFAVLVIDGLLLDDEPLWEPIEWSIIQTWIIFAYLFAWSAEVIFSSKYGSYTNRDKVVWLGLFKTYYGLLFWLLLNMFIVTVFVTLPFYFEITYTISYSVVWWNWLTSVFFFKLVSLFAFINILTIVLKYQTRWLNLRSIKLILLTILFTLIYMFYFNFLTTWFSYFTDPNEFKNSGWSDLSRITNGPLKWGWGSETRDHFSYHKTPTVFWAKNDQLILSSFLFINIFFFLYMFFLILQVIVIFRILINTNELSHNSVTFLHATLRQAFALILSLSLLVILSLFYQFLRFPFELAWFEKLTYLSNIQVDLMIDALVAVILTLADIIIFIMKFLS